MNEGAHVASDVGVVAAGPPEAARAGVSVLAAGGNAADAAAAAALACCIVRPDMTGVAGYLAAAVVHDPDRGEVRSIDANTVAPAAARADMYEVLAARAAPEGINELEYRCSVRDDANLLGGRSVSVHGVLAGIGVLWERYGSLPWRAIVEPSIELLEAGVVRSAALAASLDAMAPVLALRPGLAEVLVPDPTAVAEGSVWHRPHLAATLDRLADVGWRDGYTGAFADRIVAAVRDDRGYLTRDDLAGYAPRVTEPLTIDHLGATVSGPIAPNGAVTTLRILRLLEAAGVLDDDDPLAWHRLAEVLMAAWRERLLVLGDPGFATVDIASMLAADPDAPVVARLRDDPRSHDTAPLEPTDGRHGTLHVSSADRTGLVVALTLTHGALFGSGVVVDGTGLILGHGMSRFDPRPGRPNSVAAGKRPLNNVAPAVTVAGRRVVASGLPGARRIVSVSAQLVHRLVTRHAGLHATATGPRLHVTHRGVEATRDLEAAGVVDVLRELGHVVQVCDDVGGPAALASVDRASGRCEAAVSDGAAAGV